MPTRPDQIARRAATVAIAVGALLTMVHAVPAPAQDTYPRQPGITVTHYTFDVVLSDSTDEISMHEVVDLDLSRAGIDGVNLDLCGPRPKGASATAPGDPCVGRTGPGGSPDRPTPEARLRPG